MDKSNSGSLVATSKENKRFLIRFLMQHFFKSNLWRTPSLTFVDSLWTVFLLVDPCNFKVFTRDDAHKLWRWIVLWKQWKCDPIAWWMTVAPGKDKLAKAGGQILKEATVDFSQTCSKQESRNCECCPVTLLYCHITMVVMHWDSEFSTFSQEFTNHLMSWSLWSWSCHGAYW